MTEGVHKAGLDASHEAAWDSVRRLVGDGVLSIVMPAYNLGPHIVGNVQEVRAVFSGRIKFEIIVVNDGSTDDTRRRLDEAAPGIPELSPVHLDRNVGKGAAVIRGFAASRGDYVLFLDADLDLPASQAPGLFAAMERERADVAIGSKMHPGSSIGTYPWHRKITSAVYYILVKTLVGLPVRDTQTGIKLFRREVLEWAVPRMLVKQFAFDLELLAIAHDRGFRIAEAPAVVTFRGKWGALSPSAVRQIMNDTLAVFYRLRLLRYYQSIRATRVPDPPPKVSVLIVAPGAQAGPEKCVEGMLRQSWRRREIIVLTDSPSSRVWPQEVQEMPTGEVSRAEKLNMGLKRATGQITAFVDGDAIPADDWLERAVVCFSSPDVGAAGGPVATPYDDPFLARLAGDVSANRLVSGRRRNRYVPVRVCEEADLPGNNLLVRTEILRSLGGLRAGFWPGEDMLLCREIVARFGRKIIYDPRVLLFQRRPKLFLGHLRKAGAEALRRGYFARHLPGSGGTALYALQSLLVLVALFGGALSTACEWCRYGWTAFMIAYAAVTILSCARTNIAAWALTWLGVVSTHVWQGVCFMAGMLSRRLAPGAGPQDGLPA